MATAIMIGRLEQQICYEGIQKIFFECGRLGHRKEHCPHIIRQGPSTSKAELKVAGEACSSSRSAHAPDISRSGEGTSGIVREAEQSKDQVDMREGVYRPWIVVACRKNETKPLKSGGTSPRQSSGVGFRNSEYVEKGNLDQAAVLDGLNRETKRKLSPPKFLDKAQIASVVQSIRQEGKHQAQPSPTLMLKSGDTRNNPARPNSAPNSLRLSSVKGKKSAARNRITIGDQSSAVGVLNSNCAGLNQPQVSANLVGKDGQRRCCDGQYRSGGADGIRFTAGTVSSRGESRELGFCPGQGASTADPTLGVCQLSNQGNMEGELNVGLIY